MLTMSISARNENSRTGISYWRTPFNYRVRHLLTISPAAPRTCPFVYDDCTSRCKNCLIHLSRDVHVDLTSVKRRFPNEDISKHTFEVEFFDRSSSDVSMLCRSNEWVPSKLMAALDGLIGLNAVDSVKVWPASNVLALRRSFLVRISQWRRVGGTATGSGNS